MKKLSFILIFILLLGVFASCGEGRDKFELTYETERQDYLVGETVKITAKVTNISGRTYTYKGCSSDYRPYVRLYPVLEEGHLGEPLEHFPIASTTDMPSKHKVENGESGSVTFEFTLPEDAHIGKYTVEVSYDGEVEVFPEAISVLKPAEQNENDEYRYSPITVSAGGDMINPIRTVSSCYIQHADGTSMVGCDGMGVWNYFGKDNTDISTFPTLIREGSIGIDIPEYTNVYDVGIFDLNYERVNSYNLTSIEDVNYLPIGEYLIVLSVKYDTSVRNPNEFEQYDYEDFFRLSVPAKSVSSEKKYTYSHVLIKSGDFDIRPIQCMLWVEEHTKNGTLTGDGFGVSQIIENKEDHSDFPTLFYKGNLQVYPPVNVNLYAAKVRVYDTDYNDLGYSFDRIEDIRYLLPGEYLVVFREEIDGSGCDPEITEYRVTCNECIFKFIVPESSIGGFSFDNVQKTCKPGDPGVKNEGFKNTSKQTVTTSAEAAERAKNECTIEYDTITVLRDGWDNIWSIPFSTRGTLGGCQTVYLNDKGVTLLIVYGE